MFGSRVQIGTGACLRREFSGEPDAGNPHLRFDEGRVGRSLVAFSPTLPVVPGHGPVAIGDDVNRLIETLRNELERSIATGLSPTNVAQVDDLRSS